MIFSPYLSIILVAWNNEEHILKAMRSCYTHSKCYEIIIINNNSSDLTTKIVKEEIRTCSQKNINTIYNNKNIGLGYARNQGIKAAKGKYIIFLDGDDWFEAGAIQKILETLERKKPDILLFNHQRVWGNGAKSPNIPNRYTRLGLSEKDISSNEQKAHAIANIHTAWNKAYKKEFIENNSICFHEGFYEDVSWSIEALIKSKSTYYIPDIIVNYRQRDGSITKSSDLRHFDIFKQIQNTKKIIDSNQGAYKTEVLAYIKRLLAGMITSTNRIPKSHIKLFKTTSIDILQKWENNDEHI